MVTFVLEIEEMNQTFHIIHCNVIPHFGPLLTAFDPFPTSCLSDCLSL